jgi:hypothetical protein
MFWFILLDIKDLYYDIFPNLLWNIKFGIMALSLAKENEQNPCSFSIFFEGKKRSVHFRLNSKIFYTKFAEKNRYLNSSRKNTLYQKKNRLKWNLGSEFFIILNS